MLRLTSLKEYRLDPSEGKCPRASSSSMGMGAQSGDDVSMCGWSLGHAVAMAVGAVWGGFAVAHRHCPNLPSGG